MSQQAVLEPEFSDQFITFDNAVFISRQLEEFFNSSESDLLLISLAKRFGLGFKPDFIVQVKEIRKNCPECMGCHNGSCILGCFWSDDPSTLCFWDEAIEAVIGTKLIVHEYGHVIFDQVFTTKLSGDDAFVQSEEFAQFLERNFKISPIFCTNCSSIPMHEPELQEIEINTHMGFEDMSDAFIGAVIGGIGFGIGAAALTLIFNQFVNPQQREPLI